MGWSFGDRTLKELIANRIREKESWSADNTVIGKFKVLRYCYRGNQFSGGVLWKVYEKSWNDGSRAPIRFIACDLLGYSGGTWGYKDMEESMFPFYFSCPLIYLDMVPVANEKWRQAVREYHIKRSFKFTIGELVKLKNCNIPHVIITSVCPSRGVYEGKLYKIRKNCIDYDGLVHASS